MESLLKLLADLGGAGWIVAAIFGFAYSKKDKQLYELTVRITALGEGMKASFEQMNRTLTKIIDQ